jgi:hypothetical protein
MGQELTVVTEARAKQKMQPAIIAVDVLTTREFKPGRFKI